MAKPRVYKRRRPERTDYYRIIESRFEELEGIWPECFEQKYGYLRQEVTRAIYAFLDCGIPENGVARVFCDGCGRDYFLPFSCRIRVACPSCSTKRSILFGEKIRELVKPISHLHVTFTIPKILRAWFRRNRKLFKLMVQSANWAMRTYFIESLGIADVEHIGERTIRPPPLEPKISPPDLSRAEVVDYIPDVDAYVQDPIYPD